MILGNGVDIVEVKRIERALEKFGHRFVKKVLSSEELLMMPEEKRDVAFFLAKHWAVKEATSKAVGCGLLNGALLNFKDVVLSKMDVKPFTNKPVIKETQKLTAVVGKVHGLAKEDLNKICFHVSTSGDGGFIIASVILELKG